MQRRFARWSALVVLGLVVATTVACSGQQPSGPDTEARDETVTQTAPGDTETDRTGEGLTVGTTQGPYYVANPPELDDGNLNYAGLEGEPVRILGHVYAGVGTDRPLAGARVDFWHADAEGSYHPNAGGDASDYGENELALRGYVLTDSEGAYEIRTIYPGYYEGRTRHYHVTTSAHGFGSITTQLIVPAREGDGVTPETDSIARSLPEENHITFAEQGGVQRATFDFHLGGD